MRKIPAALTFATALALSCARPAPKQPDTTARTPVLAIVGATIVHPDGALEGSATVIIVGDRIREVGPEGRTPIPEGAEIVLAHGKWISAGYIDTHVHFFQSGNAFTRPDVADFTEVRSYAAEQARNEARWDTTLRIWLANGVTAVADVGGPFSNFRVRDRAAHMADAPLVEVAGPLISTIARPQLDLGDPPIVKVSTPAEARDLALKELAQKPDFVKVWYLHGEDEERPNEEAMARAAGDAAHAAGVPLAVHATDLDTAKSALRAGADILVHSVNDKPLDAEFLALATQRHVFYTPTLFVRMGYGLALSGRWVPTDMEKEFGDPEILKDVRPPATARTPAIAAWAAKSVDVNPVALENLRKAWDAGLTVTVGTDAGNIGTVHGPSFFREIELMARAGLTPQQVLLAATKNGAKFLRREADLGDVRPGMIADLVVLEGDPLVSVANMSRIHRVVKSGRAFDPRALVAAAHRGPH
jgi:imidazolonepropionase-like amidohydrolase